VKKAAADELDVTDEVTQERRGDAIMIRQTRAQIVSQQLTRRLIAQPAQVARCEKPTLKRLNNLLFLARAISR
jgi:hypothetical protein